MIQFLGDRMKIKIDFQSGIPLYEQIAHRILGLLERGELKANDQLPPIRELADELGVNFNTVARAYRMLDQGEVISTQHGRGTYIIGKGQKKNREKNKQENIEQLTRFYLRKARYLGFKSEEIKKCFEKIFQEGK
jgi:DNA-binding transcriptional regulator YhcF (GntR family)